MAVFVDTAALLALASRQDQFHQAAIAVQSELTAAREMRIATDWVLSEFLSVASRQPLRDAAVRIVSHLSRSQQWEIIPASRQSWTKAFDLFSRRSDKEWSLIDCSSILVCRERSIERVFSSDHHFVQAGLAILLR